jgi:hypothetical protein
VEGVSNILGSTHPKPLSRLASTAPLEGEPIRKAYFIVDKNTLI